MSELLTSPRFVRRVSWVAAFVFVAGVIAFTIAWFGDSGGTTLDESRSATPSATPAETDPGRAVPVSPDARRVAGQFILWAVSTNRNEKDLAKAWNILHPTLKEECACSRREWLTGNIPIQPYPIDELDSASFSIDESFENRVVLQVALLPKEGSETESQIFFIGLKKNQQGRWLVDYWAPRAIIEVPVTPE
jgi:hypothetical protein